jgi:hypothetical protein
VVRRVGVAAFFVPVPRFATVAGRAGVTFVGALRAVVVLAAVVFLAVVALAVVVRLETAFFAGIVLAAAVCRAAEAFVAGTTPAAAAVLLGFVAALAAVVFFAAALAVVVFFAAAGVALRLVPLTVAWAFFAAARGAAGVLVGCFAAAIVSVSSGRSAA